MSEFAKVTALADKDSLNKHTAEVKTRKRKIMF